MPYPILVSGSTGLLGSRVLKDLVDSGYEVIGLCHNLPKEKITGVDYLQIDLSSDWKSTELPNAVGSIVHLAQSSEYRDMPDGAMNVLTVNTISTVKLLEFAVRQDCDSFVYASSGSVYAESSELLDERSETKQIHELDVYASSKLTAEVACKAFSKRITTVVLRPFFIYGPGQKREMLLPRLYDSVDSGRTVNLSGNNGLALNPIHVEDASKSTIAAIALKKSDTINLAGPQETTIRSLAEMFAIDLGKDVEFNVDKDRVSTLLSGVKRQSEILVQPSVRVLDRLSDIRPKS